MRTVVSAIKLEAPRCTRLWVQVTLRNRVLRLIPEAVKGFILQRRFVVGVLVGAFAVGGLETVFHQGERSATASTPAADQEAGGCSCTPLIR